MTLEDEERPRQQKRVNIPEIVEKGHVWRVNVGEIAKTVGMLKPNSKIQYLGILQSLPRNSRGSREITQSLFVVNGVAANSEQRKLTVKHLQWRKAHLVVEINL